MTMADAPPVPMTDRRALLRRLATVGAASAAAVVAPAAAPGPRSTALAEPSSTDLNPATLDPDPDLHLLRRATYGPTQQSLDELRNLGREAWLNRQLAPDGIEEDGGLWPALGRFQMRTRSAAAIAETDPSAGGRWAADLQLAEASLVRAVWSRRQLFERVVELWSDHLHVSRIDAYPGLRTVRDRDLREHALGPFRELLLADAASPAMLVYLDNATSDASAPNENYGRELLELHTVGVEAGYTEQDVRNAALVFTGWTIDPERYTFTYDPDMHHVGPVQVLGWSDDNADAGDGERVGRSLLAHLAEHPATARTIATTLARRFVADDPPADLVDRLARTYLDNDTDIRPVLQALFTDPAFDDSVGMKVRRPIEHLAAALRAMERRPGPRAMRGHEDRVLSWIVQPDGPGADGMAVTGRLPRHRRGVAVHLTNVRIDPCHERSRVGGLRRDARRRRRGRRTARA